MFYKKKWFSIGEIIQLLKKRNNKIISSSREILSNAIKHENIFLVDTEIHQKSISVYFYSKNKLQASVINFDEKQKICIGNIEFSGYIKLSNKYVIELLDKNEASIHTFIMPSREEAESKQLWIYFENDTDFYYGDAQLCEIIGEHTPSITERDIEHLFIFRTDVAKLIKGYKKGNAIPKQNTTENINYQGNEKINRRKRNKPEIDNYRNAASNCLAQIIWSEYKNILISDLYKLRAFGIIRFHKYSPINEFSLNKEGNGDYEAPEVVRDWLQVSVPSHIKVGNRPIKNQKQISLEEFSALERLPEHFFNAALVTLLNSINYYNPQIEERFKVFNGRIDLENIVMMTKDKDPNITDITFWEKFLDDNDISFKKLEKRYSI